ncbi:hypothetical protein [Photorhabdus temperata]|nr:hypothetical protein [Photorhabdus temperata]EQC01701.1 hypothetical protein B738_02425 [Photorhabdus temperata subsp. temperata M1021]
MINKISKLNNITVSRSQANFIFFSGSVDNINLFKNTVIKNGIKISTFPLGYSKITDNSVRLSVGDKLTNDIILNLILDSFY